MNTMRTLAALTLAGLLGGCAEPWFEQHDVGDAVRAAQQAQTLNPTPSTARQGLDGVAARAAVDNYQKAAATPRRDAGSTGNAGGGAGLLTLAPVVAAPAQP